MKNLNIEKQKGSTVLISGELPWDDFKGYRNKALQQLSELVSIDGFRKGHIPEAVLIKHVGEISILEEMASLAFQKLYPTIIVENKISAIGRPSIQITKLAEGNPLGFSITVAVLPEVSLPDYKKIAGTVNKGFTKEEVTDQEVEDTINEIRTMKAKQDLFKKMQEGKDEHVHDENCNHDHDEPVENNKDESIEEVQKRIDEKLEMPEFNDEFVKTLGEFASVEDFKTKLRENLAYEKERRAKDKQRVDVIEALLKEVKLDLPELMIQAEVDQIMHSLQQDITRMGMTFEKYLESTGKTEEDIRKEMLPEGEKRAGVQVIVASIAKEEGLRASEEDIQKEIEYLKQYYKDASEESLRGYVETILTNDLVFKFLEKQ